MTTSDALKRMQDHINAMHARLDIAMTGAWPHPPTEPTQESDTMTDQPEPYDFHDEAERALLNDNLAPGEQATLHALLAIHDTLAEIRDRLPEPEGVNAVKYWTTDITEEPPRGSQVTDREGDVWEQVGAGWQPWDRTAFMWGGRAGWSSAVGPRAYAPLRFTTDEDRKRVGLPVDPAPDVDPDEALARVLYETECEVRWEGAGAVARDTYRNLARAAREHIEAEREEGGYNIRRAERERKRRVKAEADLADMTRQRDKYATQAEKWQARHAALRAGVERVRRNRTTLTDVLMCIADVLDLDDAHERTEPAP